MLAALETKSFLNLFNDFACFVSQAQPDSNQYAAAGGYYGYGQGYENYGYAPSGQDPNAYGSYPGYANYQPQQQQPQQMGYS